MKKNINIIIVLLCFNAFSISQTFKKVGTTGFGFLEIPGSARFSSLGESAVALSNGSVDGMFYNPAIIGYCENDHNVMISSANWIAETKHQTAGYVYHNREIGSIGISFIRMDFGTMVKTENADPTRPGSYNILGTFSADALCAGLTYSRLLTDRFSFGITTKYVSEKIDIYNASNYLLDAGFLYFTGFNTLRIGASIQHFGTDAKYIGDLFRMPTMFRLGISFELLGNINSPTRLTILTEALHPSNYTERISTGIEFCYDNILLLRGGYKFNTDVEGLSCGIGINLPVEPKFSFDVSYQDYKELGSIFRFGFSASY